MTTTQETISTLFDSGAVRELIDSKNIPQLSNLSGLSITPIKKKTDRDFYHLVIRYDSPALGEYPLFCSAHSEEDRGNAFRALMYVKNNLPQDAADNTPTPLFYDESLRAFFYRGMDGDNLLELLEGSTDEVRTPLAQLGAWLADLHQLPATQKQNFNEYNSAIKTVLPGPRHFLPKIQRKFPEHHERVEKLFYAFVAYEEAVSEPHSLIHGDLHPENVIINSAEGHISIIDYTDICIADPMRDLGSFMQQLSFMGLGKRSDEEIKKMQDHFIAAYEQARKQELSESERKRILLYQAWTAFRSTVYFLTKEPPEEREARHTLEVSEQLARLL